ncbi:MAG: 1-deoxy-D-xylulose-5-phosphate synthase [Gammaproteobacteria bacterium]|nr:MAG: 1-deoxy-D-xylulose-5-phosphate synthase [Gammaproteobacteria bacterium]
MSLSDKYPLLFQIDTPDDLRRLSRDQLAQLATELRGYLIDTISGCGGHFAAGLGTVELTIALHYVFNTPADRIVWDVGHQAYPHKVLTGRRDRLHTIRQTDGLHPFPTRAESEYDTFGVGHSSTSIGAALGMALAARQKGIDRKHVAVIGDGAMTAGMAFEALNHAGDVKADLLVVLNDNDMSISKNVGSLNNYFARIFSGAFYTTVREGGKKVLDRLPSGFRELARRAEEHMKGMFVPGTLFEEMGFNYIGPIDGHDLDTLLDTLSNMKHLKGPQLLHVGTVKGKGYPPAESDPVAYHGVPIFDPSQPTLPAGKPKTTFSNVFGQWLVDAATKDERVIGITPAMREGSDLIAFSEQFPDRYFDVAIAEQHAVTLAAGLACEGMKPVVAIYSTFLQRAYDQLIHDVALQNLDVTFAIDRGGIVGGDGATHQGAFDLSYLRPIPNLVSMAPCDESECRKMLQTALEYPGPAAVRYPRGTGAGVPVEPNLDTLPIGQGRVVREGEQVAILSFGTRLHDALEAAETLNATVADMRFVKPLDIELIKNLANTHEYIVTVEENARIGGAGSAVLEAMAELDISRPTLLIGLPDRFVEHGHPADIYRRLLLDSEGITRQIQDFLKAL